LPVHGAEVWMNNKLSGGLSSNQGTSD